MTTSTGKDHVTSFMPTRLRLSLALGDDNCNTVQHGASFWQARYFNRLKLQGRGQGVWRLPPAALPEFSALLHTLVLQLRQLHQCD